MTPSLLTLLTAGVLIILVVPKRAWRTVTERLRQTARGDRVHVLAPPPQLGDRPWARGAGEALRLLDAGLPLYLWALWAEARGRQVRAASGPRADASLPPARKAHPRSVQQYTMPPIAWRRDWEAPTVAHENDQVTVVADTIPAPTDSSPPASSVLRIRTLGTFQLLQGDHDLASELLRHPTLCFIWLYLLSRRAAGTTAPVHRQHLAEETFPGLDAEQQRARLRRRLSDLDRALPVAVGQCITTQGEFTQFNFDATLFDVATLREAADTWGTGTGLLSEEGLRTVVTSVESYAGEYLPLWEELEQQVTRGRGAAGEFIRSIRQIAEDNHARLLMRLAHHHNARRDNARMIPILEEFLRRRPGYEEAATLLASAYVQTGQVTRANQLRSAYGDTVGELTRPHGKLEA
jgi:DNA-binding SARP family transcriptional activator